jgi:hypothetical protein
MKSMQLRIILLICCASFFGCTHAGVKDAQDSKSVVMDVDSSRAPAAFDGSYVLRRTLKLDPTKSLDPAKVYPQLIDVYRVGNPDVQNKTSVAIFFGPIPADISDFTMALVQSHYEGLFISFPQDNDGSFTANFIKKEGIDALIYGALTSPLLDGWPTVPKDFTLVAYGDGGNTVDNIGTKPSTYMKDLLGIVYLDSKIPFEAKGLLYMAQHAPTGLRIYFAHQESQTSDIKLLDERLEHTGAVQNPAQTLESLGLTHENVVSNCLSQALSAVTMSEAFISFRCHK